MKHQIKFTVNGDVPCDQVAVNVSVWPVSSVEGDVDRDAVGRATVNIPVSIEFVTFPPESVTITFATSVFPN